MNPWNWCFGQSKVIQGWLLCLMQRSETTVINHLNVLWSFSWLEPRREKSRNTRGSLIFFESTKIKRTTLSTTVAELYALMKRYGTCQMSRGLIKDIASLSSEIHMRTDANNLVTTASTTHVPEQQETIHMIQMLRKEAFSGSIADLSHIKTQWCLADCLTKKSANPRNLVDAVRSGT